MCICKKLSFFDIFRFCTILWPYGNVEIVFVTFGNLFLFTLFFPPFAFQSLLLLGIVALVWSLYATLEVVLLHTDIRMPQCVRKRLGERWARRGRSRRGAEEPLLGEERCEEDAEQDSGVELQAVVDSEANEKPVNGHVLEI